MTIGFIFWLLMILWFIFGMWSDWPAPNTATPNLRPLGRNVLLFILLFLIGWKLFGFVVQDGGIR